MQFILLLIKKIIFYELHTWSQYLSSDFTIKDSLFGDFKLAKIADPDNNVYSGYGIAFYSQ